MPNIPMVLLLSFPYCVLMAAFFAGGALFMLWWNWYYRPAKKDRKWKGYDITHPRRD